MMHLRLVELPKLIASIAICQTAGFLGSIFTDQSVGTWYPSLIKPAFTPPGWIIGLVWVLLFTLMGISLFLVWREGLGEISVRTALYVFAAQIAANVLWSIAFFGLKSPIAGLIVIAILWALILLNIFKFWPVSKNAALLLVPCILWVSFAAFLNFSIWTLNH